MRVPVALYIHLVLSVFQSLATLADVWCYLAVDLICISLVPHSVEHLLCIFAICAFTLMKCLKVLGPFLNWVIFLIVDVFHW